MRRSLAVLAGVLGTVTGAPSQADAGDAAARRIVSLNPSLTATLVAIGAADRLVGVDEFSAKREPSVRELPQVGGLFNPSLEAVVALAPDLVIAVPSAQQRDFRSRLESLGIPVLELSSNTLDDVLAGIVTLGERTGHTAEAHARANEIRHTFAAVRAATAARAPRRVLFILTRDPLYVVGAGSFVDTMLTAAGASNSAAEFSEAYPRVGVEWMVRNAPEWILDSSEDPEPASRYWSRWPSLPAVAASRVIPVDKGEIAFPGPWLDRSLLALARILHGPDFRVDTPAAQAAELALP